MAVGKRKSEAVGAKTVAASTGATMIRHAKSAGRYCDGCHANAGPRPRPIWNGSLTMR